MQTIRIKIIYIVCLFGLLFTTACQDAKVKVKVNKSTTSLNSISTINTTSGTVQQTAGNYLVTLNVGMSASDFQTTAGNYQMNIKVAER